MVTDTKDEGRLDHSKSRAVALALAKRTTPEEQQLLLSWAQSLLEIRNRPGSRLAKTRAAVTLTIQSRAMAPLLKLLLVELKRVGWDDRSWIGRLGLSGVLGSFALAGNAGAGIAALGGAIGIPLWVVLGAGGVTLGVIVEHLLKSSGSQQSASQSEQPEKGHQ